MNKYRVVGFSYGLSRTFIVLGFDVVSATQSSGIPLSEIVKVEFVGSSEETDLTEQQ